MMLLVVSLVHAQGSGYGSDNGGSHVQAPNQIPASEPRAKEVGSVESPAQHLERMLKAFDQKPYQDGILLVSFSEDVTKEEALQILGKERLTILTKLVCARPEVSEDAEVDYVPECYQEDWNDNLKLAKVPVPKGQEKQYAQQLIKLENVRWIEPERVSTAAEGNQVAVDMQHRATSAIGQKKELPRKSIYLVVGIALIAFSIFLMMRRKKS